MEYKSLNSDQVWGRAPITEKDLALAANAARKDFEAGKCIELPKTYTDFRKVLGINAEIQSTYIAESATRS